MTSLTGRDRIFAAGFKRAKRGGFIGLGFQCSRIESKNTSATDVQATHAHNAFLESYASLGIPGLALAIIIVLSLLRAIVLLIRRCNYGACADNLAGWELAGMAVPMAMYCLTDSGFSVSPNQYIMLFLFLIVRVTTLCVTPAEDVYQLRGLLHRSLPAQSATPTGAIDPAP